MSDETNYLGTSRNGRLTADILALMMKGAGYAAIFCFVILIGAWVLLGISALLPPESKEAPDPNPSFSLVLPQGETRIG